MTVNYFMHAVPSLRINKRDTQCSKVSINLSLAEDFFKIARINNCRRQICFAFVDNFAVDTVVEFTTPLESTYNCGFRKE